jgi:hypothetical protein
MLIKVRTLAGKEIELDIKSDYKVAQIKEKVEEKEGIPAVQQRLIFGRRHHRRQVYLDRRSRPVSFPVHGTCARDPRQLHGDYQ